MGSNGTCENCGADKSRCFCGIEATPHPNQLVRVEFARGTSLKGGSARHPWHWVIIVQQGHVYHISDSFDTLTEASFDFHQDGIEKVVEAEEYLAKMYTCGEPYRLDVCNKTTERLTNENISD